MTEIVLNLQIIFGRMAIFIVLILLTHERWKSIQNIKLEFSKWIEILKESHAETKIEIKFFISQMESSMTSLPVE